MKLIDREALIVEIKRRISLFKKEKKAEKWSAEASQMNVVSLGARIAMLEEILSFIEVHEVIEIGVDVGSPEGDKSSKTVQVIDANGNIVIFNKAQKGENI